MSPQASIAHYRITAKLGEGGMGEVWRATDTKLNREVAIKILPDAFANDSDRLARFQREAQVLASLNHPNIAAIYGVEERALVMELVEGPTLAERIAAGAIPLEEAIPIATQIAEALDYAHERGIVHRDLKPANVKVTSGERVKILDFGLAKAITSEAANPGSSSTLTMHATHLGVIMGTAAYMSPEQAKGKPVDRRADIWAFGVVLWEMLTGRQMYTGETVSETLASVIKDTPDLAALPATTPSSVRRALRRCLEKDPHRRLSAIGEARFMLEEPPEVEKVGQAVPPADSAPARRAVLRWAIAVGLTLASVAASAIAWRATRNPDRPMRRFNAELGADAVAGSNTTIAISPDGTRIVYPIRSRSGPIQLATRLMDQSKATVLPGTEDAKDPFFSPNGQWIGFFSADKMKKISVQGGASVTLCDLLTTAGDRGASWGEDGTIIAALDIFHLFRIPEAGGKPERLPLKAAHIADIAYRWPQILPGGQAILATVGVVGGFDDATIVVVSPKTGVVKKIITGGSYGRYLPSGHVIYLYQGTLFAVPFDLARTETRGTPAPVQQEVAGNSVNGGAQFAFSADGTLVYLSQNSTDVGALAWLDAEGRKAPLPLRGPASTPRLSPDGKNLALSMAGDIFNYDLQRDVMTRLTFTAAGNRWPVWTPDGKHIVFSPGGGGIWWAHADGSAQPERILETKGITGPQSFSPDGRRLAYLHAGDGILILPLDTTDPDHPKPGQPELVASAQGSFGYAAFSPDGRWLAYASTESNNGYQVFVRPYPAGASGGKWQISTAHGRYPVWSRNGHELFYEAIDGHIMVTDYTAKGDTFNPGTPRRWVETPLVSYGSYPNFDLSPEGKRFVGLVPPDAAPRETGPLHATFLLNFFDELKRKLP